MSTLQKLRALKIGKPTGILSPNYITKALKNSREILVVNKGILFSVTSISFKKIKDLRP